MGSSAATSRSRRSSSRPPASLELQQLWRRVVFSVLISNTDDHLRNHAFLHVHGDVWRLAPAFDLNPSPAFGPSRLSTTIGLDDDVAAAVGHWQETAASHRLAPKEIRAMEPAFGALAEVAEL